MGSIISQCRKILTECPKKYDVDQPQNESLLPNFESFQIRIIGICYELSKIHHFKVEVLACCQNKY